MLRLRDRKEPTNFREILSSMPEPRLWQGIIENDFEEVAFAMHPILMSLKRSLYDLGAEFSLMSGSGSAVYGIFNDQKLATQSREKLLTDYPGSEVYLSN